MNKFEIGQNVKVNLPGYNTVGKIIEICYRENRYFYGIKGNPYIHFYEHELLPITPRSRSHPLTNIFK